MALFGRAAKADGSVHIWDAALERG